MQQLTHYSDTCVEVGQELQVQAQAALDAGIQPWRLILDPGTDLPNGKQHISDECSCHEKRSSLTWQAT